MNAFAARIVYCVGLLVLTACAVLPEPVSTPTFAANTARPQSTETRLAQAMRERIELQQTYGAKHPALAEAVAMEAALRDLVFDSDVALARRNLISALAGELSDALADRTELSAHYTAIQPELIKANAVISGLTAAINAEVHGRQG